MRIPERLLHRCGYLFGTEGARERDDRGVGIVEQPLLAHGIEPKASYHPTPSDMIPMRMLAHHERIIRIIMGIINHAPELPLMR